MIKPRKVSQGSKQPISCFFSPLVTLPIQLAAVDALFDLCPPSHSNAIQVCSTVSQWLLSLPKSSEIIPLVQEYNQKIEARRTSRTFSLLAK